MKVFSLCPPAGGEFEGAAAAAAAAAGEAEGQKAKSGGSSCASQRFRRQTPAFGSSGSNLSWYHCSRAV